MVLSQHVFFLRSGGFQTKNSQEKVFKYSGAHKIPSGATASDYSGWKSGPRLRWKREMIQWQRRCNFPRWFLQLSGAFVCHEWMVWRSVCSIWISIQEWAPRGRKKILQGLCFICQWGNVKSFKWIHSHLGKLKGVIWFIGLAVYSFTIQQAKVLEWGIHLIALMAGRATAPTIQTLR